MKRYIVNILLFFVLVIGVDVAVGRFGDNLQAHAKGGNTKRTNDLVMSDTYDVLILGSSRAHHHYDTPFLSDTLGMDVFNAGYDGNGVVLAYGLLEMVIERYKPRLILYDVEPAFDINVYAADNHHTRYISNLKPYFRHKEVGKLIRDVSDEEWYKVHSGLMRYNSGLITRSIDNIRPVSIAPSGYEPLSGIYTGDGEKPDNNGVEIDTFKLKYIEKLIQLAKENNIPMAMIASPKYGWKNENILKPVIDICNREGVEFINYYDNSEFMHHKEYFKEPMHLNTEGARVFSTRIVKDIHRLLDKS